MSGIRRAWPRIAPALRRLARCARGQRSWLAWWSAHAVASASACITSSSHGRPSPFTYDCAHRRNHYGEALCQHVAGPSLDAFVTQHVLAALEPAALELSLAAAEQVEHERAAVAQLWEQRRERAAYETERAARQYQAVEPENRLVARTLERAWEEKLQAQQALEEEYHRVLQQQPRILTSEERDAIRQLAADIPALWNAPTTTDADRKEIIRQVVERVEVDAQGTSEQVRVRISWAGGGQTEGVLIRPIARYTQRSDYARLCARVQELTEAGWSLEAIAHQLEADGFPPLAQRTALESGRVCRRCGASWDWATPTGMAPHERRSVRMNGGRASWLSALRSPQHPVAPGSSVAWCGRARSAGAAALDRVGRCARDGALAGVSAAATVALNIAVAGRHVHCDRHTRKDRQHDGHKSSNRS